MRRVLRRFSVVVSISLTGCNVGYDITAGRTWCLSDVGCPRGEICVHQHKHDGNWDACFVPCGPGDSCPAGLSRSSCPDSPDGTACTRDDGKTRACFCR